MPELPEVETTLRGIQPHILNNEIESINVRQPQLRWPVPSKKIAKALKGNSFFKFPLSVISTSVWIRNSYIILLYCNTRSLFLNTHLTFVLTLGFFSFQFVIQVLMLQPFV